jgi:hypothetical protein
MWVLNFLPNWAIHLIPLTGLVLLVVAFFVKFIPFITQYRLPAKALGVVLLLVGIWFEGGLYYVDQTRAEIARIERESKEATARIEEEYKTKTVIIKQKGEKIVEYVDRFITKEADARCVIPVNVVELHNSAAKNELPDPSRVANESPSGIALSTTTKTVVENYNLANEIRQQLISLQDWIREQQKINP